MTLGLELGQRRSIPMLDGGQPSGAEPTLPGNPDGQFIGLESVQAMGAKMPGPGGQSVGGRVFHENVDHSSVGLDLVRAADIYALAGKPERAAQIDALADHRRQVAEAERARIGDGGVEQLLRETPRIVGVYLERGEVAKAKGFQDFALSEGGQMYARDYALAQHLVTTGDFERALPVIQQLYEHYPDGNRMVFTPQRGGQYRVDFVDERTNEQRGSRTLSAANLSRLTLSALNPLELFEYMAHRSSGHGSHVKWPPATPI